MLRFLLQRLAYSLVAIIAATVLVFGLSRVQGDPRYFYLTGYATQEMFDAWGKKYGLDKPLVVQYGIWLGNAARGDFGESLRAGRSARDVIIERIPATLQLALAAFLFAFITGVPLGVLSAVKRGSPWDYSGRAFAIFGQALPPFWIGILMILLFAVRLGWLPTGTRGGIDHYVMPAITLGWLAAAGNLRLVRSAMLDVLDSEYVKFARSKGVREVAIVWKHALRNAIIPPLTFAGLTLAGFMAGTVVTETVFAWPGIGRLAVDAVMQNDFPVMTGVVLILTLMYVVVMMIVDIAYAYVDPRIRYG
jgi:peptide/nickel transport system permease protein